MFPVLRHTHAAAPDALGSGALPCFPRSRRTADEEHAGDHPGAAPIRDEASDACEEQKDCRDKRLCRGECCPDEGEHGNDDHHRDIVGVRVRTETEYPPEQTDSSTGDSEGQRQLRVGLPGHVDGIAGSLQARVKAAAS